MPAKARDATTLEAPLIRRLATDEEAHECAQLMASSDPWQRLGRDFDQSYRMILDSAREVYVAVDPSIPTASHIAGFVIVIMQGAFVGYLQSVAVREECRGRGLGTALIEHAERRILRDQPNVFILVSSFNPDARRLYERLGYQMVGELTDYIIKGHSEFLLRKTIGPLKQEPME
jgi:ribosomal protein S18 acetylase RimI-like enzyme